MRVYETKHELFNSLWEWMVDDNKESILEDEDGEELYPGFELYMTIAESVHNAVPADQFHKKLFTPFITKDIPHDVSIVKLDM